MSNNSDHKINKAKKTDKKLKYFRYVLYILNIITASLALFFFYQTKILSTNFFLLLSIVWSFILIAFIFLGRRFLIGIILLCFQIIINLAIIFGSLKYNNYFSQIKENQTYVEKYSLVTLSELNFSEKENQTITPLGVLNTDPYREEVERFLTNNTILSSKLSSQDIIKFDNLLLLTNSLLKQSPQNTQSSQPSQSPQYSKFLQLINSSKSPQNPQNTQDTQNSSTPDLSVNNLPIKTIFLNHTYLDLLKENNQEIFSKLKILQDFDLPVTPKKVETAKNSSLDRPFLFYLSGIDNRDHTLPYAARSDVNLLLAVNPRTHMILILNTPRDFYVPLAMNGQKDKLTHAGLYGVNESIHTLENFYQTKINYYARINFDAFSTIIDQIGGIDINIPYTVNTFHGGRHYSPGNYHLNGEEALDFARERVSISWAGGDRERGRNQEKILLAVMKKIQTDAHLLGKFDNIFTSITKNVQTNLTGDNLKYLIQRQLTDLIYWRAEMIDVDGKADITSTYTYPEPKHFVWHPYPDSVEYAKTKLKEYLD